LPDNSIRKPLSVSGLAEQLGVPEVSQMSALKEAQIIKNTNNDEDDDIFLQNPAL
jgi:hypothetical protein